MSSLVLAERFAFESFELKRRLCWMRRAEGDALSGGLAHQRPARKLQSGSGSLDHCCWWVEARSDSKTKQAVCRPALKLMN